MTMRAIFVHELPKATKYDGQVIQYIQQKLDGHRVAALRQPPGCSSQLLLYTRTQADLFPDIYLKAMRHKIWSWAADLLAIPPFSSIDGELHVPGKPASYVKTAIKECDPNLRFTAFAVPWMDHQRRYTDSLEWAMEQASHFHIPFIPFYKLNEVQVINAEEWLKKAAPDTEGWMLKRFHYSHWYKLKRMKTIDLVVMGSVGGKGKYEGMLGALKCGAYDADGILREVCLCSGMTDTERVNFSKEEIGRVCEIQYQEVASLGRLRHPVFLRWRDDEKQPFECTMAQEPELLRYWSGVV